MNIGYSELFQLSDYLKVFDPVVFQTPFKTRLILKDLSVIIVNYRCWDKLAQCLDSLTAISQTSVSFEVIVVDNASEDGRLLKFRQLYKHISFLSNQGNWGFSSGNNLGATAARGKYLLFLNPDTIVSEKVLTGMLDQAKVSNANSIISCRQIRHNGDEDKPFGVFPSPMALTGWTRALAKLMHLNTNPIQNERFIYPDWVSGSVILISKASFNTIGAWDERFWLYYEDVDLCQRARAAGGEVLLLMSVALIHNHGGSSRSDSDITALTKAEVNISQHEYISLHEKGIREVFMHAFLILNNIVFGFLPALLGLFFFFNKRLSTVPKIYLKMLDYYFSAFFNNTWISPRSMQHPEFFPLPNFKDTNLFPLGEDSPQRA